MRVVDFFCGAGGMSLGLRKAGFSIERAYDEWDEVRAVYDANFSRLHSFSLHGPDKTSAQSRLHHSNEADASDILACASELIDLEIDMICGGPPCQDFSAAGKRIEGTRADLTAAFSMIISIVRPKWFLLENVVGARKSKAYERARKVFKRAGYGLTEVNLDASYYGVPQSRMRFFVIGRLSEADGFLDAEIQAARSERPMTIREALGDDVGVHPGGDHPPEARAFFIRPFNGGRGVRSIDEPCPTVFRTTCDNPSSNYRAHPDDLAPVEKVRSLSFEEVCRIQGFPKDWHWDAIPRQGKRGRMQAAVNAVPPPLAEALGRLILKRDRGESIPALEPAFTNWLKRSQGLSGQMLRNRKAQLNRARRLIGGRSFDRLVDSLAALERAEEFKKLPKAVRSDLRKALRLYAAWKESCRSGTVAKPGIGTSGARTGETEISGERSLEIRQMQRGLYDLDANTGFNHFQDENETDEDADEAFRLAV